MKNDQFNIDTDKSLILDQYKHFVDTAEAVSDRRLKANTFFISLHSLLISVFGLLKLESTTGNIGIGLFAILGCLLSLVWFVYINSFKRLNKLKFEVIHEMEAFVPFRNYQREWEIDKLSNDKYIRISNIERIFPFLLIGIYIIVFILKVFDLF